MDVVWFDETKSVVLFDETEFQINFVFHISKYFVSDIEGGI